MRLVLALSVSLLFGWLPVLVQAASVRDCLSSLTFDQVATDQSTLRQGLLRPVFSYDSAGKFALEHCSPNMLLTRFYTDCASGYYLSFDLVGEPGRPTVRCTA